MSADTLRLFFALEIPRSLRIHLSELINELRKSESKLGVNAIKWVNPENMHLTLKFFGETQAEWIEDIKSTINSTLPQRDFNRRFHLKSRMLGAFPNFKRAKVLWADIGGADTERLIDLAEAFDKGFEAVGFEPEKKRFRPHLTIGRVRPNVDASTVIEIVEQYPYGPVDVTFDRLALIRSELTRSGPNYTTLASWTLGAERFGD